MIKAAVLGATGYAGIELVRLLTSHPEVSIEILGSHSFAGQKISDVYKNFNHVLEKECEELDLDKVGACDVAFTALPHGASKSVIPSLLEKGLKVIDLSGDYRYDDVAVYEKWYGEKHSSPELLKESVYGLPELHRDKIKNARLIGNPGCYTTCSILGTVPLLANKIAETKTGTVTINVKSITGYQDKIKKPVTESVKGETTSTTIQKEVEVDNTPNTIQLKVTVDGETVTDEKVKENVTDKQVSVSGKGNVTIKVYIDGILKKTVDMNLNNTDKLTIE